MSLLTTLACHDFAKLIRIPSLEVYFDAIASPLTVDGSGNISQWNDISGKGNHAQQVGSDPMPLYVADKDGYPAVYSDGAVGTKLDFSHGVGNNDDLTVIALFLGDNSVSDPSTGSSLNVVFAFGGADSGDNSVCLRHSRDDAREMSFVAYGDGSVLDGSPFADFEAYSIVYDGSNTYAYYGETLESDSGDAASSTRVFGNGRLFNEDPASSSRTGIGWLRCLLLFKEALSDDHRNAIIAGLKARYGVS